MAKYTKGVSTSPRSSTSAPKSCMPCMSASDRAGLLVRMSRPTAMCRLIGSSWPAARASPSSSSAVP